MPAIISHTIAWNPDGTADVTARSAFSNKFHTRRMEMNLPDYERWMQTGEPIQNVLPRLSPDDREFLLTGVTPEEWDEAFKKPDDE